LAGLELSDDTEAHVLAVLAKHEDCLTVNLKAPLVLNLAGRLGRQVVTTDEQPLQLELAATSAASRKIA
jgi:flagellar assembly factor FliW